MANYHPMRKPDYFYQEVARKLGVDLKLVRDVNKWFWSQGIKKNISKATHRSLYIKHLGTVTMSRKKLYNEIYYTIRRIRKTRSSNYRGEISKAQILASYYERLRTLLHHRNLWAVETVELTKNWKKNV